MIKITESLDEETVTLRIDGRVVDRWVEGLERLCLSYRYERNKTVVLDFSGVDFIDDRGVRMLERIKDKRIRIINCSLFIETLLNSLITANR